MGLFESVSGAGWEGIKRQMWSCQPTEMVMPIPLNYKSQKTVIRALMFPEHFNQQSSPIFIILFNYDKGHLGCVCRGLLVPN